MTSAVRTDAELQSTVTAELEWTPSLDSARIGVSANRGAVTLTGEVDTYPEMRLAEKAALRVRGVRAVAQEITVSSVWAPASDTDIAREAGEALDHAVDVPTDGVEASVHDRQITLSGQVAGQHESVAAERAVRHLRGVTGVINAITITAAVPTDGIRPGIEAALSRRAALDARHITVSESGGAVVLAGTVRSVAEEHVAVATAWSAPGVTAVTTRLRVGPA